MPGMWRPSFSSGRNADALALETNADHARLALACAYWSAAEYEADVIRARRQAGAFGPRRHQRQAFVAFAVATALISAFIFVVPL